LGGKGGGGGGMHRLPSDDKTKLVGRTNLLFSF